MARESSAAQRDTAAQIPHSLSGLLAIAARSGMVSSRITMPHAEARVALPAYFTGVGEAGNDDRGPECSDDHDGAVGADLLKGP